MTAKYLACIALLCALVAQSSQAAPILSVRATGVNTFGDSEWIVEIAPDPSLFSGFPPGGSMAVELAFLVEESGGPFSGFSNFDVNTAAWDSENPGFNPFTGTITTGLWLNPLTDPVRDAFGAFGSIRFTSGDPVRLFTISTGGSNPLTKIHYGTAASGSNSLGARIAQAGINFDGYTGWAMNVPEPATAGSPFAATVLATAAFRRRCKS